jgi:lactobin A/cerein 7B family class IIb bacteriocin
MKTLNELNLSELDKTEIVEIEGGILPALAGGAAIAAGAGMVLGAFIVGAAVAYGTCKLIEWAFK